MARPRDDTIPEQKTDRQPGQPLVTLAQLRAEHPWMWMSCRNPDCGHAAPFAIMPLIIRWGPDAEVDRLRGSARCQRCGHKGVTLSARSWHDTVTGFAPWPPRFMP